MSVSMEALYAPQSTVLFIVEWTFSNELISFHSHSYKEQSFFVYMYIIWVLYRSIFLYLIMYRVPWLLGRRFPPCGMEWSWSTLNHVKRTSLLHNVCKTTCLTACISKYILNVGRPFSKLGVNNNFRLMKRWFGGNTVARLSTESVFSLSVTRWHVIISMKIYICE